MDRRRCAGCGTPWPQGARYCGHCGEQLGPRKPDTPGRAGDASRGRPRGLTAGITLGIAAVLGATVWIAAATVGSPETQDPDVRVDLPAFDPPERSFQRPEVRCDPEGCELWRVEVGHGTSRAFAHGVYHVTRGSLLAVDAADGRIRWRADLPRPGARLLEASRDLEDLEAPLLLSIDRQALHAWDVGTGELRWELPWPTGAHVAAADHVGEVLLLATSGDLPGTDDLPRSAGWPHSGVAALDAATGELRWVLEVDQVVDLAPRPLVIAQGELVALGVATGQPRWRRAAVAAGTGDGGSEVGAIDGAGITVVDADTGAVRDRVPIALEGPLEGVVDGHPRAGPGTEVLVELHDRLLVVAARRHDGARQPTHDGWELTVHDRASGVELRRFDRASAWRREGDLLLVLAGTERAYLDALSTTDATQAWSSELTVAAVGRVWVEPSSRDQLLVGVAGAQDEVEIVSLDAATGQQLGRYGGVGWEAMGDGILADRSSEPVAGSINVTRLAGPEGTVGFTREVTIVSTEPTIVRYWDELIRLDELLLFGSR